MLQGEPAGQLRQANFTNLYILRRTLSTNLRTDTSTAILSWSTFYLGHLDIRHRALNNVYASIVDLDLSSFARLTAKSTVIRATRNACAQTTDLDADLVPGTGQRF